MNKLQQINTTTYGNKKSPSVPENHNIPQSASERLVKEELERLERSMQELKRLLREVEKKQK